MSAQPAPRLWTWPFIAICLAHFALSFAFHASMPVFPLLLRDRFDLAGAALGVVVAMYTTSAIMTRPPTGFLLDRFGRRIVYLPAYGAFALVYFLYPLAVGPASVGLIRFLHGALWGVTMGAAATAAVDLLPDQRRGEGIGYFGLGMILSMAAGPAAGMALVEARGFDFLFRASAALTLAGFALACFLPFPAVPRRNQRFSPGRLLEKTSLPASLATLIFCVPYGAVMNFTSLFARSVPGAFAGTFFLFLALGTGITRFFAGRAFDAKGPGLIMHGAYVLLFAGCVLKALASGPVVFYAAALCLGMGYGIAVPVIQAMVNALVPPERRGAANATMMTAFDLGICVGLVIVSHIQSTFGWTATYALLAGCVAASWLYFVRRAAPLFAQAPKF